MSWQETHTHTLTRLVIRAALASRPAFYTHPDLAAFAGNGGDKINKKLRGVLALLEKEAGTAGMVREQVAALGRKRKGGEGEKGKGKKRKVKEIRKVKEEVVEEEEVKEELESEDE